MLLVVVGLFVFGFVVWVGCCLWCLLCGMAMLLIVLLAIMSYIYVVFNVYIVVFYGLLFSG